MSERVKKYCEELKLCAKCTPSTRKVLFKHGDNDFIKAIADATWTTLDGRIPLTPMQIQKLREVQNILRLIASKERTIDQKRRLLCTQKGGNAFNELINIIHEHF